MKQVSHWLKFEIRVAPIIVSVIGIGQYSTVSVIGISIVLLSDYALLTSYILGRWYLQVEMEVKRESTGAASEQQALRYA